jgi:small subunit ribosomal protein S5
MNRKKENSKTSVFYDTIVDVRRVVKVVKGGRIFSFSVLAIIGNKKGVYGIGKGKALDATKAKKKAISMAKNRLVNVNLRSGRTINHSVEGKFGASSVILRPAQPGTGVVAGGAVRSLLEIIGVQDIVTKTIGSSNVYTVLRATSDALESNQSLRGIGSLRSKTVKEMIANIKGNKQSDEDYTADEE